MQKDIRESRQLLNLSQIKLARMAGLSVFRLKQWEIGNQELTESELASLHRALRLEGNRVAKNIQIAGLA